MEEKKAAAPEEEAPKDGRKSKKVILAACAVGVAAAIGAGGYLIGAASGPASAPGPSAPQQGTVEAPKAPEPDAPAQKAPEPAQGAHVHDLAAVYEAVTTTPTETVHVEDKWDTETEYHTLCNVCGEIIDNATQEHEAKTGHKGFTREAPVEVDVLVEEAHDEEVAGEPVTSMEITGYVCSSCGEAFTAEEAKALGEEVK